MEEKTTTIVADSLKSHMELAKQLGREHCSFTEADEKYIDMFWDQAFNKSWLYLSEEIVVDWLGYKKSKDTMYHFYRNLTGGFEEGLDYEESRSDSFDGSKMPLAFSGERKYNGS